MLRNLSAFVLILYFILVANPSTSTAAQETTTKAQASSESNERERSPQLATVNQWDVGVAVGYGQQENIILGQSDMNIYLVPTISYYGKHWFFDNATLGYSLTEQHRYAVSVVTEVNPYSAQFYDFHPVNILLLDTPASASMQDENLSFDGKTDVLPDPNWPSSAPPNITFTKPDWNLDLGIQHNWFMSPNTSLVSQIFTDITQVHHGVRANITWSYSYRLNTKFYATDNWFINFQLGLHYLDQQTTQYFYGVDERFTSHTDSFFNTQSAVNKSVSVHLKKPLTDNMSALLYWKTKFIDSHIQASPRVDDNQANTYFVGLHYEF